MRLGQQPHNPASIAVSHATHHDGWRQIVGLSRGFLHARQKYGGLLDNIHPCRRLSSHRNLNDDTESLLPRRL